MCTHSWRVCVWLLGCVGQQGWEGGGWGGMRSTAPYCHPAVAACEALLSVPSKSHLLTHKYSKIRAEGCLTQTHARWASAGSIQNARLCLVCLCSLLSALFFKSSPHPPAGLLCQRFKKKIEREGEDKGRGREGPCVRMEKIYPVPCGQTLTEMQTRT